MFFLLLFILIFQFIIEEFQKFITVTNIAEFPGCPWFVSPKMLVLCSDVYDSLSFSLSFTFCTQEAWNENVKKINSH